MAYNWSIIRELSEINIYGVNLFCFFVNISKEPFTITLKLANVSNTQAIEI